MSHVSTKHPAVAKQFAAALGRIIREEREQRRVTGGALARAIGVRTSAVSKWELGQRNLPLFTLLAICGALQVSPSRLLRRAEEVHIQARRALHAAD